MTALTREGITVALASLLENLPGVVTFSRRLRHWNDVDASEQPAIFLSNGNQSTKQDASGLPAQWSYDFKVHIYNYSEDPIVAPSTALNNLLDALEGALKPVPTGMPPGFPASMQVLGDTTGRIRHAWISGPVETDEGVLGPQAIAIVPIEVLFV